MTNEPKAGKGIDPEMLAAYIEKRLSPEQRAAVEAQLASDLDSYAVLVESMKALDAMEAETAQASRTVPFVPKKANVARRVMLASGALAAAAAALILVVMQPEWLQRVRGIDPQVERLVAAVGNDRYFEARLTGGFKHAPFGPVTRAPQPAPQVNLSLLATAGELQKLAQDEPTAEHLHAWGLAQLLVGQLDGAIESLSAAAAESDSKAILSDLAAAYVTRAINAGRSEDWPQALEAASKAVEGESSPRPEALFNRALAAEALNLRAVSEQYWDAYIAAETDPAWRAEGTLHLQRLRDQPPQSWQSDKPAILNAAARAEQSTLRSAIPRHSQRIREMVEDELLPTWARQLLSNDGTAASTLSAAARVSDALTARTGDDLLSRSIHVIEGLDRGSQARVATGVQQYAAGRAAYERAAMQDSVAPFSAAKQIFERERLPLSEWCGLYLATAAYYRGDYPSSLDTLDAIIRRTSGYSWFALSARAYWLQGLISTQRAEYDRSLALYTRTLQLFERLAESENQAAVHSLLATALLYLGDEENVWLHTVRALQTTNRETAYRRQHMILTGAINRAIRLGLPHSALVLADQAAVLNDDWNDAIARIEIANYRARTLLLLNRPGEAKQEVESARQSVSQVTDRGLRQRAEAEVMQSEADVLAAAEPEAGVVAATKAIDYFTRSRSALRVPRLYIARAAARRRLGDAEGALADLREGALSFDRERQTLPRSERLRLAFSDEVWTAYRQLVAAEVDRGASCEDVLKAAERARAITIAIPEEARPGADLMAPYAADATRALVAYAFLDDRLAIVAVRGRRCDLRVSAYSPSSAQARIAAFRSELNAQKPLGNTSDLPSSELFVDLIAPVWRQLEGARELEVIADGPLHYMPFAALRLPDGSRLIEAMSIRMVPSLDRSQSPEKGVAGALVSSGGAVHALSLPPLPGAAAEVSAVSTLLKARPMSIRGAQTSASFLDALRTAEVVHFAGHAIVNEHYPLLSRLVLAGSTDDEWVTADQVTSNGPIGARLVFLSACSTQAGRQFGAEGPASLAKAFVVAGAQEVVASLWPVADDRTPHMVAAFYRHWLQNGDAAAALRLASIESIRERKSTPEQWAAWIVVGRSHGGTSAHSNVNTTTGD